MMNGNISIRRATEHDAFETARVFAAARDSLGFLPALHTPEEEQEFIAGCIADDVVWLAMEGEAVRGFASIAGEWLDHLYVDPAHHRRGIGHALFTWTEDQCPEGFQLWCFQANARARRFYEARGCVAAEFTDGAANEEKLPDMRYVWRP